MRACGGALAEQLAAAVAVPHAATVATLLDDVGTLRDLLSGRIHSGGLLGIDGLDACRRVHDGTCDAVVCLLAAGFAGTSLLSEARRMARPQAPIALLTYDRADPPAHEAVLLDAGLDGPYLGALVPGDLVAAATAAGFTARPVRDVARFDSPAHFWRVMVEERPLAAEIGDPAESRARVAELLRPWQAADDTLRIPVVATLLLH